MWFVHRVLFEMSTVWIYWARSRPDFTRFSLVSVFFIEERSEQVTILLKIRCFGIRAMHRWCQPYIVGFHSLGLNMVEISRSDQLNFSRSISDGFFHVWSACHHLSLESFGFSLWVCHKLLCPRLWTQLLKKYEWNDIGTVGLTHTHTYECIYICTILYHIQYLRHKAFLTPSLLQSVGAFGADRVSF